MSDPEQSLNRLFRAAGRVTSDPDATPPFGFTSRVLAQVRAGRPEEFDPSALRLCRNMLAWAFGLAFLSVILNAQTLSSLRSWHDPQDQLITSIYESPLK